MVINKSLLLVVFFVILGGEVQGSEILVENNVNQENINSNVVKEDLSENIFLPNPIGKYKGEDIDREDFSRFMEIINGIKIETVPADKLLKNLLINYLTYVYLTEEARKENIDQSSLYIEMKEIAFNFLLASKAELDDRTILALATIPEMDVPNVSLEGMYYIAKRAELNASRSQMENLEWQKIVLAEYIKVLKLASISKNNQIDTAVEFQKEWEVITLYLLADHYVNLLLDKMNPSDAELQETYDLWLQEQDPYQYKVSHIYLPFENEDEGLEILAKLQSQKLSFIDAVSKYSIDEASKDFEGKVGRGNWVTFKDPQHPFFIALESLSVGEYSKELIRGIAGYHIIKLDDKALVTPDKLVDKKEFIIGVFKNNLLEKYYKDINESINSFLEVSDI